MHPAAGRRRRAPVVLVLVYGIFLVLIGITATAQALLVSANFTTGILNSIAGNDAATIRTFVNGTLVASDLDPSGQSAARVAALAADLQSLTARGEILRAEIRRPDGVVLFSNEPSIVRAQAPVSAAFSTALGGQPSVDLGKPASESEALQATFATASVLREYLPIIADGRVRAVFAVWRDAQPILARLDATRQGVVLVTLTGSLIAMAILFLVFRGAQTRISRQTAQLIESTRLDPLTGLLNHGAAVAALDQVIDEARKADQSVTVALLDIDNFKLLNDTHGHGAGDQALTAVANLLKRHAAGATVLGRYGPDEFLIVSPPGHGAGLEPALEHAVAALADHSLQFAATERLPVTISAAISHYPEHAASVTALLSVVATTLEEAKASGGNAIRVTDQTRADAERSGGFDVLRGLVIAVDTKDRYTKRHSEDVARYALFLADRIGLDPELRATLRIAGLLHDVGKIGIPDDILRKPGALSAAEMAVVQQHVALGDSIVRNLPNIDQVRAAVRFHHERWDGRGYLDGLTGTAIPLIARLIAVGDVFSAMTTTRPYRKALDVKEALVRLGDAAGSQLDEELVTAFIAGIETDANAPLPGQLEARGQLWAPISRVA